jgi:hypothetical protein
MGFCDPMGNFDYEVYVVCRGLMKSARLVCLVPYVVRHMITLSSHN